MDPNANIAQQVDLANEILGREMDPEDVIARATELAELVLALDDWRSAGGFDPYATK